MIQREPWSVREGQALACGKSLWLILALCGLLSGSIWLPLAHWLALQLSVATYGYLWLSLALIGPLWLSVAHTPAPTGSLCHSPAHSDSLWLTIAGKFCLYQSLLGSQRRCHADTLYPGLAEKEG